MLFVESTIGYNITKLKLFVCWTRTESRVTCVLCLIARVWLSHWVTWETFIPIEGKFTVCDPKPLICYCLAICHNILFVCLYNQMLSQRDRLIINQLEQELCNYGRCSPSVNNFQGPILSRVWHWPTTVSYPILSREGLDIACLILNSLYSSMADKKFRSSQDQIWNRPTFLKFDSKKWFDLICSPIDLLFVLLKCHHCQHEHPAIKYRGA